MTDVTSRRFPAVAITIVHALGLTWQHFMTDAASQIIVFPINRTVYLRFVRAGGGAPAIAVEIVDGHGNPVATPPDPAIWLLPYGLSTGTAARQIKTGLIEPYRATQIAPEPCLDRRKYVDKMGSHRHIMQTCRSRRLITP